MLSYAELMGVGDLIQKGRAARDWSQRDLARALRVSPSTVAQWEKDETLPTIAHRLQLARELGIPFDRLLPEAGDGDARGAEDPLMAALLMQAQKLPRPGQAKLRRAVAGTVEALAKASQPNRPRRLNKD